MDADSMRMYRSASDVQDSQVLVRRILDDLNRASRQGFHLFDFLLDAVSGFHCTIIVRAKVDSQTGLWDSLVLSLQSAARQDDIDNRRRIMIHRSPGPS
jgi:hypothetical protein